MEKKPGDRFSTKKTLPPISKGNVRSSHPSKAGADRPSVRGVGGAGFSDSLNLQAEFSPQPMEKMSTACEEELNQDSVASHGHPERQAELPLAPALSTGLPGAAGDCALLSSSGATGARAEVRGARRKAPQQEPATENGAPENLPPPPLIAAALRRVVAEPLRRKPRVPAAPALATGPERVAALDPPTIPAREVTAVDTPVAPVADPAGDSEDDFEMIELPESGQGSSSGAAGEGAGRYPRGLLLDSSEDEEIVEWTPASWDSLLGGAVAHLPPAHFFRAWRPNSQGVLKHLLGDIGSEEGADDAQATDEMEDAGSLWGGRGEEDHAGDASFTGHAERLKGSKRTKCAREYERAEEAPEAEDAMEVDRAKGPEGAGDAQSSDGFDGDTDSVTSGGDDGRPKFGLLHEVVGFID